LTRLSLGSAAWTSASNNASAVWLRTILDMPMKRYDLINGVNARGTFLVTQKCLPHLLMAENPHVLAISPPLNMDERWFAPHVAYSISKFGMSLVMLGVAGDVDVLRPTPFGRERPSIPPRWQSSSRISISVRYGHRRYGRCRLSDTHVRCEDRDR
jgi:hypothetical protein